MAVTGETAKYKLPYFKPGDSPPDLAAVTKAISERVDALLAKGGDVSIAADGTITIGAKKVTGAMLADAAVNSAKVEDGSIADADLAKPTTRGLVTAAGAITAGSGFTAEKLETGRFRITLNAEAATTLVPLAIANSLAGIVCNVTNVGKKSFDVETRQLQETGPAVVLFSAPFAFSVKAS
jgi:hypothetical protein